MSLIRLPAAVLAALLIVLAVPGGAVAQQPADGGDWYTVDGDEVTVDFYFYWSPSCPHCREAKPYVEALPDRYDWIRYHDYDITGLSGEQVRFARSLEEQVGEDLSGVPAFFFCERLFTGYDRDETTGAFIEAQLTTCHAELSAGLEPELDEAEPLRLPIIGSVDPDNVSLPIFTVAVAALDAFNPCAFFVLLFLLSLLVHARSRARMALIGGIFVLFSGLIYFVFMAAWLNVFLWVGPLRIFTVLAGMVALALAALNIKDFFLAGVGPSLSIRDDAKPGLFKRMRGLTTASSFGAVAVGAVTLAVVANSYELLCTTGFPLVFTRVLTLNELPTGTYYSYLVLYNLVYVLPLLAIVTVFVWRLGSRKLGELEGRALKLLAGTMMAGMGIILVVAPDLLSNLLTAVALLGGAIVFTAAMVLVEKRRTAAV